MSNKESEKLRIGKEEELKVVGMHCATCSSTVSKSIKGVKGVKDANVNLASGIAKVEVENARLKDIVNAIRKAGYDVVTQKVSFKVDINPEDARKLEEKIEDIKGVIKASVNPTNGVILVEFNPYSITSDELAEEIYRKTGHKVTKVKSEVANKSEVHEMLKRLIIAWVFTIPTLYFQYSGLPLVALFTSIPVQFYAGLRYHLGAYRAFKNRTTNMDTLVSLSTNIAWFYSLYAVIVHQQTFFDVASLLVSFILIGKTLEAYLKERISVQITSLRNLKARLEDGRVINAEELKVGDKIIVKGGEVIPADGIVDEGKGEVNESIVTGESMPVKKGKGDAVIGGSTLISGYLKVYVTRTGERTYISQVVEAVNQAQTARLPIQNLVDKVSSVFTPVIIGVSALVFTVWKFLLGFSTEDALLFSVATLASACPCPFGLATPLAVLTSVNRLAKKGIIVRNGESLEILKKADTFIFDKTGTITEGKISVRGEGDKTAISYASAIEKMSNHPIAKAISSIPSSLEVKDFTEFPGSGVYGKVDGHDVIVGKRDFVLQNCEGDGKGDVLVCVDGKVTAWFYLEDKVRDDSVKVIDALKKMGKRIIIATGDNSENAEKVGKELEVDVIKGLSADEKAELVKNEVKKGRIVAFIGDGINDAIAIKEANVGIAISSGTDIAKYAGDIIIPKIGDLLTLLEYSRLTVRKIKENLAWAFGYNSILVPIAAGLLYPAIYLPPEYAALAMSMDSVAVSLWSLVKV
ncbi:copper-translocating P-type ATPase [Acidianus sp. HS-5]|uniref:heavy metal translocating P-type ATPase n=1 Tax=Acidianus sp. HS-5 TaxID=2886040 RepID=UPI001F026FA7|nr:copper-translocating P-type ATPase [Acidianus sp. HS-5]BDC17347.1 copper-translocating P-type ATPase [Acidianus sp. HS-5]